jgi:hypothetical protein
MTGTSMWAAQDRSPADSAYLSRGDMHTFTQLSPGAESLETLGFRRSRGEKG